jgi:hypothetical protein
MTLGARMSRRDGAVFVGREAELAFVERLFVDDPPLSVVLLHGPGGIGKSGLLREVERRGALAGWTPHLIEGRDLPPVPEALEEALSGAREEERPLLLFDSYERLQAMGGYLRGLLLPAFPERTIVVIAGRRPPEPSWFEGGWESLAAAVELEPLSSAESRALLVARGLAGDARLEQLVAWASGSPLALTLAAWAAGMDHTWKPTPGGEPTELARSIIWRLAESGLQPAFHEALAVATIARVTTLDVLEAALPDSDPQEGFDWLCARTFVEPLGRGVALHELVRRAVGAELRQHEPDRERELRRRIVDHLHARAVAGELMLTIDLAELAENPVVRSGYSWQGSIRHRIDGVRPGDADRVAELLGADAWWDATRPFFDRAPARVAIARDAEEAVCGYSISVTPASAPELARMDLVLGPWLAHAQSLAPDGNAVLWRDSEDFSGDPRSHVRAMVNMAGILRSGLKNPRYAYLPIDPASGAARAFSTALAAHHLPQLDVEIGERRVECHLVDYGAGGLLSAQRDLVYAELGLVTTAAPFDAEIVRHALRNFHVPHELADSPLAVGAGAASVRELLEEAAEQAFGETENERLLQRVLVRGYITPATSHEQAAHELNLSRSAYFRRLSLASRRVAEYLSRDRGETEARPIRH